MRARLTVICLLVALLVAACGGGGDDEGSAAAATPATASGEPDKGSSGAGLGDCPLTPAQVSEVLGVAMHKEADAGPCRFVPTSGDDLPTVHYTKQSAFSGTKEYREEARLTNEVSGLGDEAWADAGLSTGITVLVHRGDDWFEVVVNTADLESAPEGGLASAKQLPALVLSG